MNEPDDYQDIFSRLDQMTISQLIQLSEAIKTVLYTRARQSGLLPSDTQEKS